MTKTMETDDMDIDETEAILQDKEFMASLEESDKQMKAGLGIPWNEAKKRLKRSVLL